MAYAVEFTQLNQEAMFDLRCIGAELDQFFLSLGVEEKIEKNQLTVFESLEILRLGPRRTLIKSVLENESQIEQRLNRHFKYTKELSVVNISDQFAGIKIIGVDMLEVLAHVVPINLYEFPPGSGTSTAVFSQAGIVIRGEVNSCSVYVERSYLHYVWRRMNVCGLKLHPTLFETHTVTETDSKSI